MEREWFRLDSVRSHPLFRLAAEVPLDYRSPSLLNGNTFGSYPRPASEALLLPVQGLHGGGLDCAACPDEAALSAPEPKYSRAAGAQRLGAGPNSAGPMTPGPACGPSTTRIP